MHARRNTSHGDADVTRFRRCIGENLEIKFNLTGATGGICANFIFVSTEVVVPNVIKMTDCDVISRQQLWDFLIRTTLVCSAKRLKDPIAMLEGRQRQKSQSFQFRQRMIVDD